MTNKFEASLFIFRRDLRLHDNTALINAIKKSKVVLPCFIFDPRQVTQTNKYLSNNAIQFMIESLKDLQNQLKKYQGKIYLFHGKAEDIVKKIIKKEQIDAIFFNRDYTPFSMKRDKAIEQICQQLEVAYQVSDEIMLNDPETIKTGNNTPYEKFTAYWKKARKNPVKLPEKIVRPIFYTKCISFEYSKTIYKKILPQTNNATHIRGGRSLGLKIFRSIGKFKNYQKTRDIPSLPTTCLSAHIKFGTVSLREAWHVIAKKLGPEHPLLRQLYWHDFYTYIAYHSPFVFGHAFQKRFENMWWENDRIKFKVWCQGKTGFPIIDAGMRQLNTTGFMHNRVRMIVASFLTKDLHIDWQWGEKYFAQRLVDYDPAINNGNWQWTASTGCDAQPYFRIFNPWLQQKKFDPECIYIKQWVPELKSIENKIIHNWFKDSVQTIKNYPRPIINHNKESIIAKKHYKQTK